MAQQPIICRPRIPPQSGTRRCRNHTTGSAPCSIVATAPESAIRPVGLRAHGALKTDLNQAAPTKFARFQRVLGDQPRLRLGRRVRGAHARAVGRAGQGGRRRRALVSAGDARRATSRQGRSSFAPAPEDEIVAFEIESWARSGDRLSNLLYHRIRMAKEVQLHMWISFLEGVTALSGGTMSGGVDIDTQRVDDPFGPGA